MVWSKHKSNTSLMWDLRSTTKSSVVVTNFRLFLLHQEENNSEKPLLHGLSLLLFKSYHVFFDAGRCSSCGKMQDKYINVFAKTHYLST